MEDCTYVMIVTWSKCTLFNNTVYTMFIILLFDSNLIKHVTNINCNVRTLIENYYYINMKMQYFIIFSYTNIIFISHYITITYKKLL